ncbi:hypothetical protein THAOC_29586 [Thalassiosira oceanica]|uniref:Uncharacterized protein n=1 Tax=Thalassiosira oceanica TaxID=159749 RepID=K0RQY1_THAOC|nr:hypothetical protein THAOC_29586 [Thalassiosira oceanica]|eukprot:EJK51256.1 hypothetical protein THAOC_29586 [Thalassiosira oceanica]
MPESERADDSGLEYTPPLPPWCTSGQYWPSPDGPLCRASSRWVSCFLASVTLGPPMQGLCVQGSHCQCPIFGKKGRQPETDSLVKAASQAAQLEERSEYFLSRVETRDSTPPPGTTRGSRDSVISCSDGAIIAASFQYARSLDRSYQAGDQPRFNGRHEKVSEDPILFTSLDHQWSVVGR